jgi:hypothetical protein
MAPVKMYAHGGCPAIGDHRLRDIYMRIEKHPTLLEEAALSAATAEHPPIRSPAGEPLRRFLERMLPPSWLI